VQRCSERVSKITATTAGAAAGQVGQQECSMRESKTRV